MDPLKMKGTLWKMEKHVRPAGVFSLVLMCDKYFAYVDMA
jgi:hypothetical protein